MQLGAPSPRIVCSLRSEDDFNILLRCTSSVYPLLRDNSTLRILTLIRGRYILFVSCWNFDYDVPSRNHRRQWTTFSSVPSCIINSRLTWHSNRRWKDSELP